MSKLDASTMDLTEVVVDMKRVSKTVKGGRVMKLQAIVVVGDKNGHVGCGIGKASDYSDAIKKGIEDAKKNMVEISLKDTTIPHEIVGTFRASNVLLKPAPEGTGVIAGGPVRAVVELAGIENIRTKSLGSNNKVNVVKATIEGLKNIRTAEAVAQTRGLSVEEILG